MDDFIFLIIITMSFIFIYGLTFVFQVISAPIGCALVLLVLLIIFINNKININKENE